MEGDDPGGPGGPVGLVVPEDPVVLVFPVGPVASVGPVFSGVETDGPGVFVIIGGLVGLVVLDGVETDGPGVSVVIGGPGGFVEVEGLIVLDETGFSVVVFIFPGQTSQHPRTSTTTSCTELDLNFRMLIFNHLASKSLESGR